MAVYKPVAAVSNVEMSRKIPPPKKPPPPRGIIPRRPVPVFLKEWREHFGLTQQQVADRLPPQPAGKLPGKGTVNRWENETRGISLDVLAAYAEALNIPVLWLYRQPADQPTLEIIEKVAGALLKPLS